LVQLTHTIGLQKMTSIQSHGRNDPLKRAHVISLIFGIACASIVLGTACVRHEYHLGKDTVKAFGNGRYQIVRVGSSLGLMDLEGRGDLSSPLVDWNTDGLYVYTLNENGKYTLLNLSDDAVFHYDNINSAPDGCRSQFKSLRTVK